MQDQTHIIGQLNAHVGNVANAHNVTINQALRAAAITSTDNAIVRFDGTQNIQGSLATVSDTGAIVLGMYGTSKTDMALQFGGSTGNYGFYKPTGSNYFTVVTNGNDALKMNAYTGGVEIQAQLPSSGAAIFSCNRYDSYLGLYSEPTNAGGNIIMYGDSAASAYQVQIRKGTSITALFDSSQNVTIQGGNLAVSRAASGAQVLSDVYNSSNTASATALHKVRTAGTTADDPFYLVSDGTTNYSWGLDASVASDPFVMSANATLGTTNFMSVVSQTVTFPGTVLVTGSLRQGATAAKGGGDIEGFTAYTAYDGTSNHVHNAAAVVLDLTSNTALSGSHSNTIIQFKRIVTADTTDTSGGGAGKISNLFLGSNITADNGHTYTYADADGFSELHFRALTLGAGTTAVTTYHKINIADDTGATGTNKYGLKIGTISGGSGSNYSIFTSTATTYLGGKLQLANSTVAAPANMIELGSKDDSGSTKSTLNVYTEYALEAFDAFTATHKARVWWNGTEYWLQLDAV